MDSGSATRPADVEDALARGSHWMESAARTRGLTVDRLAAEIIVCSDGERRVAFRGLVGSSSSRVAHRLCRTDQLLRRYLASHGLPVISPAALRSISQQLELAVVGGRVIAAAGVNGNDLPSQVRALASEAVEVLPGASYASVSLVKGAGRARKERLGVSAVDPHLARWGAEEGSRHGVAVADAILALEFAAE
jgi:hypothetical protein